MTRMRGGSTALLGGKNPLTEGDPGRALIQRFASLPKGSVAELLFAEGYRFSFFQAVRLLARLSPDRQPVGFSAPPAAETVRFRAHVSLSFPPSAIHDLQRPSSALLLPRMTVTFFGMAGPSGILPRHYTELLLRLHDHHRGPERTALRDWLDLFNHRLLSLFYRVWTKYRFWIAYERGESLTDEPDNFTQALFSMVGLGTPGLRGRLAVSQWEVRRDQQRERLLARVSDFGLLQFGGLLAHRPPNAVNLEAFLSGHFGLPVHVQQFRGEWVLLDKENQSAIGGSSDSSRLGVNVVVGERVWDIQSKVCLRVGPMRLDRFNEFQPDRSAHPERKAFFLLLHLARLYIGMQMTFDVQLILQADEVPECRLGSDEESGARLGWNTWTVSRQPEQDVEDAVFAGDEIRWVNPEQRWAEKA
jgi:type VI secretion system protein ImpH